MASRRNPVVVVGGGLAGLSAALFVARGGWPVRVVEKHTAVGGRAATRQRAGFRFNLGPHALYEHGPAVRMLRSIGIAVVGGVRGASGGYAVDRGVRHTLPAGFCSLITTGLMGLTAKIETGRVLTYVRSMNPVALQQVPLSEWVDRRLTNAQARAFFLALVRLTTYAHDPERQSAGAALAQVKLSLNSPVLYLHDGWQSVVDQLDEATRAAGAEVSRGVRATAIQVERGGRASSVQLADGRLLAASAVILAMGPGEADVLLPDAPTPFGVAPPVRLATLDLALRQLPFPRATLGLGVDRPLYYSVHSAVARLAPDGGALVHVAKYLPSGATGTEADERDLEQVLDVMQPGWREAVVYRRYLPALVVSNALVTAQQGGLVGRPGSAVTSLTNLFLAGDWIGPEGQLADASVSSAKTAADLALRYLEGSCATTG